MYTINRCYNPLPVKVPGYITAWGVINSRYEISYSFTLVTGDLVEGYYKGSLNSGYDATKSAKKSAKFKQTYREK